MTDEVEKVISMSLNKMAESRAVRRGGGSLHKHLLISSVLSKARCAYLETWFTETDETDSDSTDSSSNHHHNLSPADDSDSSLQIDSASSSTVQLQQLNSILDPRYFLQIESEIELPHDILNCVEKLGDISSEMGFEESAEMILQNVIVQDLNCNSDNFSYLEQQTPSPPSQKSKRQRGWSFENDDSDDETEEPTNANYNSIAKAKRIRFSLTNSSASPTFKNLESSNPSTLPLDPFFSSFSFKASNNFRTKKSQFEVDEIEEEDDSSFLLDALDQDGFDDASSPWVSGNLEENKNDRRVPSSTGSCSSGSSSSSSDEEQDANCGMEVDTITNLVQYISFSKQKGGSGLVRSLSTPDLCSAAAAGGAQTGDELTKNLFSSYRHHQSHRATTITY